MPVTVVQEFNCKYLVELGLLQHCFRNDEFLNWTNTCLKGPPTARYLMQNV